jgi:hypothetical protein
VFTVRDELTGHVNRMEDDRDRYRLFLGVKEERKTKKELAG